MRFAVFTHVPHLKLKNKYSAYAPYVKEMNIWFSEVEEVEIIAPLAGEEIISTTLAYVHPALKFTQIPSFHFLSIKDAFKAVYRIPLVFWQILAAVRRADHLHLRCPGNIGLIACIVQIFFPKKPKTAKYAGNWDPQSTQPWTYNFQKWILSNTFLTRNMQVLVYGVWPHQSRNVKPFFTASFSEKEREETGAKEFNSPYLFLFVGNLVPGKQSLLVLQLIERLSKLGVQVKLEIYGEGQERQSLENYCAENGLEKIVRLMGSRSLQELKKVYATAHFLVLPSRSEGWPKAVAEAMYFGCIPVATPVSCVPWMINYGRRGILASPAPEGRAKTKEWLEEIGNEVEGVISDPGRMNRISVAARDWSQQYTLERFKSAIQEVLKEE